MNFTNPVYLKNFPDPFCIYFGGSFWCFCSGFWKDGRVFGVLHSTDLVHWEELAGAMAPLAEAHPHYWAPEVAYLDGQFTLYYSVGNEETMHLRVAVADHPAGPYVDCGRQLTNDPFAIDAHVFEDDDGARYLFYASDHLERERAGTGTVVDRLIDPLHLAGRPSPVSLPAYDWQVFDPRRASKNNLRWHTIEGSFTLKHKGRYYQMFSGGNYQNLSYGVSYAITDDIQGQAEWEQFIDGEKIRPILCTVAGKVLGPGHNSVVVGPDQRQLYCVYHVIQTYAPLSRIVAIDPLEWVGEHLVVLGASYLPQPVPIQAENPLAPGQVMLPEGKWTVGADSLQQPEIVFEQPFFLLHFLARALDTQNDGGPYGTAWRTADGQDLLRMTWLPGEAAVRIDWIDAQGEVQQARRAFPDFRFERLHALRMELNGQWARVTLGAAAQVWDGLLGGRPEKAVFFAEGGQAGFPAAEFSAMGITYGSEDGFWQQPPDLALTGWLSLQPEAPARIAPDWQLADDLLIGSAGDEEALLVKELTLRNYELVVNVRGTDGSFIIFPAINLEQDIQPFVWMAQGMLNIETGLGVEQVALDELPEPQGFYHIRCRKVDGKLRVQVGQQVCGEYALAEGLAGISQVGLGVRQGSALFDLVRITKIL